jgi:Flp pilus assembly pilin Flp
MWGKIQAFLKEERGQALSEYGLIVMLVGMGAVGVLFAFRGKISSWFKNFGDKVDKCSDANATAAECGAQESGG